MACQNNWSDNEANTYIEKYKSHGVTKDLALRTYSARLLGSDPELVLHGGGNTSVKSICKDLFENDIDVLHVKGSGWDLATIEPEGHPAVKLNPLLELKSLRKLSDEDMVSAQRQNLMNINSPNPSVETLLHAFIPYKYIDHTHSLALLAIANQPNSAKLCKQIFGDKVAIVPYVMPGFNLAIKAFEEFEKARIKASKNRIELEGMVLINHGLFTFGDTAKTSYERMIRLVNIAEEQLTRKINLNFTYLENNNPSTLTIIPYLRGLISKYATKGKFNQKWIFEIRNNKNINEIFESDNLFELINRGVATPDHVIRTKSKPLLLEIFNPENKSQIDSYITNWVKNTEEKIEQYIKEYENYFNRNIKQSKQEKKQLDPLPRLILIPGIGLIGVGSNKKSAIISADIGQAWIETVLSAESIGKFKPVGEKDTFDLEYWSLEQAKLGKQKKPFLSGNIVAITGGGGVIGEEISREFKKAGAEIVVIDFNKENAERSAQNCGENTLSINCDVTSLTQIDKAFKEIINKFGGLDILISNAGSAWEGSIEKIEDAVFMKSMELNLFSHYYASKKAIKIFHAQDSSSKEEDYLMGGQILFNISKQSLNPGPNFGSYGIPKTALLALMRQISLEEGSNKIRANGINADRIRSGLLNKEMIKKRAASRGLTEEDYMTGNLLKSEILPKDVALAFLSLAKLEKTTGALLTVDGGNVAAMVR
ncbi:MULTISPECIES: bifunctional aldolase/short-chain dehydrogenase [Prochlorococcus]|uniref:Putative oxidoreductase n=1 Tax=Prochlorococcus marinus str. MIT 9314 TaxID=167548 RepID=A0A0A2AID1_PROMR|nr:bifunctional aldolase/short-chain dehydrogenase [Prochlorococcus marinus]KGG00290.1 putative oxidoreductase [Prochlorococcus marinus str. MIT 9314]